MAVLVRGVVVAAVVVAAVLVLRVRAFAALGGAAVLVCVAPGVFVSGGGVSAVAGRYARNAADGWGSTARLLKERRRRLLPTTKTLENAIAAPASMGLSSPRAASGIASTL